MILVGLGGNLPSAAFGAPRATLEAALDLLAVEEVRVVTRSRWYRTRPVPDDGQPWYTNGVAAVATGLAPDQLLERMLEIERRLGRVRGRANAPRTVDLDLLAYDDLVRPAAAAGRAKLPHPRLHERAFVLVPLAEIAPGWRHPVLQRSAADLLAALPDAGAVEPLPA